MENGLNWVEDPSNHEPWCTRNRVRQFLADNADLNQAATEMHADLCRTKLNVQSQGKGCVAILGVGKGCVAILGEGNGCVAILGWVRGVLQY